MDLNEGHHDGKAVPIGEQVPMHALRPLAHGCIMSQPQLILPVTIRSSWAEPQCSAKWRPALPNVSLQSGSGSSR